jgi:hypothetical protein
LFAATPASEAGSAEVDDPSGYDLRREAQTWLFRACVRLNDGQTFSNLLDARKLQMDKALASVTVISWACTNTARIQPQDSNDEYLDSFAHASTLIRLGSLRRVLPEKQTTAAGEIVEVTFKEVQPGPGKDYRSGADTFRLRPTAAKTIGRSPLRLMRIFDAISSNSFFFPSM